MVEPLPPVPPVRPDLLAQLRRSLQACGWDEGRVREQLGVQGQLREAGHDIPRLARRLDRDDPAASLTRLLFLGMPLDPEDVTASPVREVVDALVQVGLLAQADSQIRCPFRIVPQHDHLVVCDAPDPTGGSSEQVMGPTQPTQTLSRLTVRRSCGRALDLGCGSGLQSLWAAAHTDTVTAVDVNDRAVALTELNAALNGIDHVEVRSGDWFEPVAGERFDLVVANPPYVVSPDVQFLFRDSPLHLDGVSRFLATRIPDVLTDGGAASVLTDWALTDQDWETTVRAALDTDRCDVLALHYTDHDPLEYAARWNAHLRLQDTATFEQALDRWQDAYDAEGVTAIASVALVLGRRDHADGWFRAVEMRRAPGPGAPVQLERMLAADPLDDDQLLDARIEPVEGLRVDQIAQYRDQWDVNTVSVHLAGGVGTDVSMPATLIHVLFGLQPDRSVRDVVVDVAPLVGIDGARLEVGAVDLVRRLYLAGMVRVIDQN